MSKPLIGLTPGHNTESQDIFMRPTYMEALSAAGAIPVVLPLTVSQEDCGKLAETFDGFLFTGGPDPIPFFLARRPTETAAIFPSGGTPWRQPFYPRS